MKWVIAALRGYATFSGRSRRKEYWMFFLFYMLVSILLAFVDYAIGIYDSATGLGIFGAIFSFVMFLPYIAVTARRLHDTDKSGWRQLLFLIPIFGLIPWFIWMATQGDTVTNKFGPDPKFTGDAALP